MKKLLFLLSCLLMLTVAYSQEKDTVLSPTKVQLMKKSRVQKTFGWFMAGTGVPVVLSCMYFLTFPDDAIEKGKVVAALTGGIIYTVGGISLIRKGKRNKEKALSLGLGPANAHRLSSSSISGSFFSIIEAAAQGLTGLRYLPA